MKYIIKTSNITEVTLLSNVTRYYVTNIRQYYYLKVTKLLSK